MRRPVRRPVRWPVRRPMGRRGRRSTLQSLYVGSILASITACSLRGYGHAGTQNDRLGPGVILSTDTSVPAQQDYRIAVGDAESSIILTSGHMCLRWTHVMWLVRILGAPCRKKERIRPEFNGASPKRGVKCVSFVLVLQPRIGR